MRLLRRFPGSKRVSGATAAGGSLPQAATAPRPTDTLESQEPQSSSLPKGTPGGHKGTDREFLADSDGGERPKVPLRGDTAQPPGEVGRAITGTMS